MDTIKLTAYPERWLGERAPGGLALPSAQPNRIHLFSSCGRQRQPSRTYLEFLAENDHALADIVDFKKRGT